jgi:multidrug efflux pump subunit AcrA (membrane-fusion protein)
MKATKTRRTNSETQTGQLVLRAAEAQQEAKSARKRARLAKAQYKAARKAFKKAKKAARHARKLVKAAGKVLKVRARRAAANKSKSKKLPVAPPPGRKTKETTPMVSTAPFPNITSTATEPPPAPSAQAPDSAMPVAPPKSNPAPPKA